MTYGLEGMASWGDILAWEAAAGLVLDPWERSALARLSHARAMVYAQLQAEAVKAASGGGARQA